MTTPAAHLHTFPLGDETVCLDTRRDRLHVANDAGVDVWRAWAAGKTAEDAIGTLLARYDAPEATLAEDVQQLYAALARGDEFKPAPVPDYVPILDPVPAREPTRHRTLALSLPGVTMRCRVEHPGVAHELAQLFALELAELPGQRTLEVDVFEEHGRFPIVHDGTTLDTGLSVGDAAIKAMREIAGLASRIKPWTVILHASAAALNGTAVLFPAIGGSGKTTLVAWLSAHGWRLLNDDAVPLLADDGRLCSVPVALSVKSGSWPVLAPHWPALHAQPVHGDASLRIRYLPVEADRACPGDVPCALIALPCYDPTLEHEVLVTPLSPATVLRDIVEGGCVIDRPLDPARIATLVDWIASRECVRIGYRDAEAARRRLEWMLRDGATTDGRPAPDRHGRA